MGRLGPFGGLRVAMDRAAQIAPGGRRNSVLCSIAALVIGLGIALGPGPAHANGWEHHAIPRDALLRALESDDDRLRARAAVSFGVRHDAEALDPLLAALERSTHSADARSAVYEALGRIGDARAVPVLVAALRDEPREELRGDAATALGAIGAPEGLPALLAALENDIIPVQVRVIDALGAFQQPESLAALQRLVADPHDQALRIRAIRALGHTRSAAAMAPLLAALAAVRSAQERGELVDALGRIGAAEARDPLVELLEETDDPALRTRITAALGSIRDGSAVTALMALLEDGSHAVRLSAVLGLTRPAAPEAAGPLRDLYLRIAHQSLPHEPTMLPADPAAYLADLELMREVVRALIAVDPATGLPAFLDGAEPRSFPRDSGLALKLGEEAYALRRLSIVGLGYTASAEAAAYLDRGPLHDPDHRLRAAAVRAVGVLRPPDAVVKVLPALEDSHPEVRWNAASVLGWLGDPRAVAPLVSRLEDNHAEVRFQAATSLGFLGGPAAWTALEELLRNEPSRKAREAARRSLSLLGEPPH